MFNILLIVTGCISFLFYTLYSHHDGSSLIHAHFSHTRQFQDYISILSHIYNRPSTIMAVILLLENKYQQPKKATRLFLRSRWETPSNKLLQKNILYDTVPMRNNVSMFVMDTTTGESPFSDLATYSKYENSFSVNVIYRQIQQKNTSGIALVPPFYKPLSVIPIKHSKKLRRDKESKVELPTIYLMADPSEVALMHENKFEKITVAAKMLYSSSAVVHVFDHVDISIAKQTTRILEKMSYDIKICSPTSLNGSRRLKFYSFGYDLAHLPEKIKYRMLASMKMPTTTLFTYVRIFINSRPIGIFGLINNSSVKTPWLQDELRYPGRNLFQQEQGIVPQENIAHTGFTFGQQNAPSIQQKILYSIPIPHNYGENTPSTESPSDTTMDDEYRLNGQEKLAQYPVKQIDQDVKREELFKVEDSTDDNHQASSSPSTRQTNTLDNIKDSVLDTITALNPINSQDAIDGWDPSSIVDYVQENSINSCMDLLTLSPDDDNINLLSMFMTLVNGSPGDLSFADVNEFIM
ncbi:hypothetical protein BDA99DRAFT_589073 [Phascolomyces articulosus]|uniref:Uncharacterized protein n=1 Tax=Phascolomyces articulosus TaxID=60185 RepID=A0AAD5K1B6_9FUNG|nr:hypothetical protein BDA99DRAFT_589073 [Phascolomyces articulosus]